MNHYLFYEKNTYSDTVLIVGMQANLSCRLHLIALNSIVIVCMHRVCKVESLSYLSCFTISNVIAPHFICIDEEALLGYINILHIRFPSSMNIVCCGVFLMQYKVGRRCYRNIGQEENFDFDNILYNITKYRGNDVIAERNLTRFLKTFQVNLYL